jgi:hypothetical protein
MALRFIPPRFTTAQLLNAVHRNTPRAMSTAASTSAGRKYEWLVVVPDFPGALEKRLEVRPYVPAQVLN